MATCVVQTVDMALIERAAALAAEAHKDQKRKYSDAPYFVHPDRMAKRGIAMGLPEHVVAALYLHDVLEDCDSKYRPLIRELSVPVLRLVKEVTNPSKEHPELRRHERKAMDREHLKHVTYHAKVIKFIDRIDNIRDMVDADKGFLEKYVEETMLLKSALLEGETATLLYELALELKQAVFDTQLAAMRKSLR